MNPPQDLPQLIHEFLAAQQAAQINTWRMVDLAGAIRAQAGSRGLHQLAHASGLTVNYLRTFARLARLFPPETRVAALPFHHHIQASHALRLFPAGTPEHEPTYWLQQAQTHRLSVVALHEAMAHHTVAGTPLATRQAFARTRVRDADRERRKILRLVDGYNRVHAPYWGTRLVLTEQPLLSAPPQPPQIQTAHGG